MTEVILKNSAEHHQHDATKLSKISANLASFKESAIDQDIQFSKKSTQKLKESLKNLEQIKRKAKQYKNACTTSLQKLKAQQDKHNRHLKQFEAKYSLNANEGEYKKKQAEGQKKHIYNCQARLAKANEFDYKRLGKIDIPEKKSQANDLFKWILVTFYFETEAKFYFPNFIEQVLQQDKGLDLKERLAKINAYDAKDQQRLKTEQIIKDEQAISNCVQFKGFEKEVKILFEIAKLFLDSCHIGRNLRKQEKTILEFRKSLKTQQEQNDDILRDRNSISERIALSEAYLKRLNAMEHLFDQKSSNYSLQISHGQEFFQQLCNKKQKKSGFFSQLNVDGEEKERSNCECNIF